MPAEETGRILDGARERGWVLEPDAKRLLAAEGFDVPRFEVASSAGEAVAAAGRIGYPVVMKVVSPEVIHKSDAGGVIVGVEDEEGVRDAFAGLSRAAGFGGALVEEMLPGVELIVGGKVDGQFGPIVLIGMGGVGVEIYNDTSIRMAPLTGADVDSMIAGIRARKVLDGYRGAEGIDREALKELVVDFSRLLMDIAGEIESVDLNPVLCTAKRCVIADARIMLKNGYSS